MKNYDIVDDYCEGFAAVMLNGKWGFIDEEGNKICEIKYDYVGLFDNGFADVKLNDEWCFIDQNGLEYDKINRRYIKRGRE